jgi:hypothetical protein
MKRFCEKRRRISWNFTILNPATGVATSIPVLSTLFDLLQEGFQGKEKICHDILDRMISSTG